MTAYKNFIQDFPDRCGKILEENRNDACKNGLEVTHMLSIAVAAITIPFARLYEKEHPSGDKISNNYQKAIGKFTNLCDRYFLESNIWNDDVKSWKYNQVKKENVPKGPDCWETTSSPLTKDIKAKKVLGIIRNSLAHGSIFTRPNAEDPIENILFLSEIRDNGNFCGNYELLMANPEDFYEFLVKWIKFLRELKIPLEVD